MLTISEIQERYRTSRDAVLSWITSQQLKAIDVAPAGSRRHQYRVSEEALQEFERRRSGQPAPSPPRRKPRQFV